MAAGEAMTLLPESSDSAALEPCTRQTVREFHVANPEELLDSAGTGNLPVHVIRRLQDPHWLKRLGELWIADRRSEVRQLLVGYLRAPLNSPGHEVLIRTLLRQAEQQQDDQVMGLLLVAFDRTIRRTCLPVDSGPGDVAAAAGERPDRQGSAACFRLRTPADTTLLRLTAVPAIEGELTVRIETSETNRTEGRSGRFLFSVATRRFLQRRLWRYFRRLATVDSVRYLDAVCHLLREYRDTDTPDGTGLLDCHGLIHVLFGESEVVQATKSGWQLSPERRLAELHATPPYRALWAGGPERLWKLAGNANSRVIRQWAIQLLQVDHEDYLRTVACSEVLQLLVVDDVSCRRWALQLMAFGQRWPQLSAVQWRELLVRLSPECADELIAVMETLLCSSPPMGVVTALLHSPWPRHQELVFQRLSERAILTPDFILQVLTDAGPEGGALPALVSRWIESQPDEAVVVTAERVLPLLEHMHWSVRMTGMRLLERVPCLWSDPEVTRRIAGTRFQDVRHWLVRQFEGGPGHWIRQHAERPMVAAALAECWMATAREAGCSRLIVAEILKQAAEWIRQRPQQRALWLPLFQLGLTSGKKGVFELSVRLLTELLIDCEELRPALEDMGIRRG